MKTAAQRTLDSANRALRRRQRNTEYRIQQVACGIATAVIAPFAWAWCLFAVIPQLPKKRYGALREHGVPRPVSFVLAGVLSVADWLITGFIGLFVTPRQVYREAMAIVSRDRKKELPK